jgi:hypothetical protein
MLSTSLFWDLFVDSTNCSIFILIFSSLQLTNATVTEGKLQQKPEICSHQVLLVKTGKL